jgi:hypothetical protein
MQSHKKNKTAQFFFHNAESVPASKHHDLMAYIMCHVDPLLDHHHEISNYTTAAAK